MVRGKGGESGARMMVSRVALVLASAVLLIALLAGCAPSMSIRLPTAGEIDSVKQGRAAVALFRINATIDGKPVSPLEPGDSNNALRIYLANLDEMGAPTRVAPASFSQGMAAEGWHYVMLPPGVYYLLVLPPGLEQNPPAVAYHAASARFGRLTQYRFDPGRGGFWSPELMAYVFSGPPPPDFQALAGFWFQVPENGRVVYLGSLSIACRSGRGLFGALLDSCSDFDLVNDPRSAAQAVATALPGVAVNASPLVPYGRPQPGTHLAELGAMNIVAPGPAKVEAAFTGAVLAPWGVVHSTGRPRALGVYNLLAVGFELATRAGADARAEERAAEVRPCIERLAASVGTLDYASRFIAPLKQAAQSRGIALELDLGRQIEGATRGARDRLVISVPIVRLREAGQSNDMASQLALELALTVRIEAGGNEVVRYHSTLYSAPDLPIQSPLAPRSPLYARFVPERPTPRPAAEWCAADAAVLLEMEISAALSRIAAQVVRDLLLNSASAAGSKIGLE